MPWNYGERLRISGYEFTGGVLAGIFMSVPSSNRLTSESAIGFRAYGERVGLSGVSYGSGTYAGVMAHICSLVRYDNSDGIGFRASELW